MRISTILLSGLLGASLLMGCKKDEPTREEIIIDGTWTLTDTRSDIDGDGTLESDIENCDKDDTWDFMDNGKYATDEGATKCDPSDPQTATDNWSLSQDGNTLTVNDSTVGLAIPFTIVSLTDKRMELSVEIFGKTEFTFTR